MIYKNIRTQKAKGILSGIKWFLYRYSYISPFCTMVKHRLIQNKRNITDYCSPCFARPCPTKPRHGFVDSRVIKDKTKLIELWKNVLKHDINGEMILGPYLPNVVYNMIYVSSGMLSVGRGNDGATAGKKSINFSVSPHEFSSTAYRKTGINKNEAIYIEAILPKDGKRWILTQMRGGPNIKTVSPNFVNRKTKVEKIIRPINDLLKWEKLTKKLDKGTIVYAPGHTLASHAAIHCILNNIPFITTNKPKIGDVLASTQRKKNNCVLRRRQFKRGVRAGINICRYIKYNDMAKLFYFSISVLHNWPYLRYSEHADWILGSASIILAKLCAALSLGEYRHKDGKGGDYARENIYVKSINNPTEALYKLPKVFKDFYSKKWDEGFGGIPWANCAWYSHLLWKNIIKIFNHKNITISDNEINNLVTTINKTINLAHNNGWWFNKFTTQSDMDFIAKNPGLGIMCVSDLLMNIHKAVNKISGVKRKLKNSRMFAPCDIDNYGNLVWAKIYGIKSKSTYIKVKKESRSSDMEEVKLTQKEFAAIRRKYRRENRKYKDTAILTVRKNKIYIPGGKQIPVPKVY